MQNRLTLMSVVAIGTFALMAGGAWWSHAGAQGAALLTNADEARSQLSRAQSQASEAKARAEKLSQQAESAEQTADRSAQEIAALAARIQQAEANVVAGEARIALITDQRRILDARLADRQEPIVRLTAALQNLAQRPLTLSALRPGSLKETVYVRAVLESAVPEIRQRTASIRSELNQARELEQRARTAVADLRGQESTLQRRRQELAALETRHRRISRETGGIAMRESERALALAEQARDLGDLIDTLDKAAELRRELAALPGPILRPAKPNQSRVEPAPLASATPEASRRPPGGFQLPVNGRTITGFGAGGSTGALSEGLTLSPSAGAQVIAPSAGRVAFAGPYRGFGQIVIIEHGEGWTSLVTGLERTGVVVGDELVGGSPIGNAAASNPAITLELRRDGEPVNPVEYVG